MFARHRQIDFGQQFAVDERAVQDALAAVYVEAATQGIQAGFLSGKFFPRHGQGVGYFAIEFFDARQPHAGKFHIEEADVEAGVVDNQFRPAQEVGDLPADLLEFRRVAFLKLFERDAVHRRRFFGDVAVGMDVEVQVVHGQLAFFHFDAGKFQHSVAAVGIKARGLRIQNNLSFPRHVSILSLVPIGQPAILTYGRRFGCTHGRRPSESVVFKEIKRFLYSE